MTIYAFLLSAISIDRYIAIHRPIFYKTFLTMNKTLFIAVSITIISLIIHLLPLFGWNDFAPDKHCLMIDVYDSLFVRLFVTGFVMAVMLLIAILYAKIGHTALKQSQRVRAMKADVKGTKDNGKSGGNGGGKDDTRVFKRLALMVGLSSICLVPYTIVITMRVSREWSEDGNKLLEVFELLGFAFGICNSWLNPVIYAWKFDQFRQAFKEILCKRSCSR